MGLEHIWRTHLDLGAKDPVPEPTRDSESILIVCKVVLEMVLLELLVVCGEPELC